MPQTFLHERQLVLRHLLPQLKRVVPAISSRWCWLFFGLFVDMWASHLLEAYASARGARSPGFSLDMASFAV
jgi:hypothetical protein